MKCHQQNFPLKKKKTKQYDYNSLYDHDVVCLGFNDYN